MKQGIFYFVKDSLDFIILEDKTKRGLTILEKSLDAGLRVEAEKGMIHDMDGIGRKIAIRWYFPKKDFELKRVIEVAEEMELRYKKIREETCPDY